MSAPTKPRKHPKKKKTATSKPSAVEYTPILLISNEPTEFKARTLELIYESIALGQLGYMDGKDGDTGEIVPLLVGLKPVSDTRYEVYPIARLLINKDDHANYLVPNGAGDYSRPDPDNSIELGAVEESFIEFGTSSEEGSWPAEGLDKQTRH